MTAPSPVLIATDLTDDSNVALVRGHSHARSVRAPLVVCHVVPDFLRNHPLFPQRNETDVLTAADLVQKAAERVSEQVGRVLHLGGDGFTVEIETGNADEEIVRLAEQHGAQMIVVGAKPRTGAEKLIGRVAERVVRYAHVPVLVARPGHHTNKILVATDFTDGSMPALRLAQSIMKAVPVDGTLLHVMQRQSTVLSDIVSPLGGPWIPPAKSAMDELERLGKSTLDGLAKEFGFAHAEQVEGEPADVIADRAAALDVEMILMGSRGRTGLARLVLGSTAEKVIRNSLSSVLVTRER